MSFADAHPSQQFRFHKVSRPLATTIEKGKIDDYEMQ
jgi:hypothetical protein